MHEQSVAGSNEDDVEWYDSDGEYHHIRDYPYTQEDENEDKEGKEKEGKEDEEGKDADDEDRTRKNGDKDDANDDDDEASTDHKEPFPSRRPHYSATGCCHRILVA